MFLGGGTSVARGVENEQQTMYDSRGGVKENTTLGDSQKQICIV